MGRGNDGNFHHDCFHLFSQRHFGRFCIQDHNPTKLQTKRAVRGGQWSVKFNGLAERNHNFILERLSGSPTPHPSPDSSDQWGCGNCFFWWWRGSTRFADICTVNQSICWLARRFSCFGQCRRETISSDSACLWGTCFKCNQSSSSRELSILDCSTLKCWMPRAVQRMPKIDQNVLPHLPRVQTAFGRVSSFPILGALWQALAHWHPDQTRPVRSSQVPPDVVNHLTVARACIQGPAQTRRRPTTPLRAPQSQYVWPGEIWVLHKSANQTRNWKCRRPSRWSLWAAATFERCFAVNTPSSSLFATFSSKWGWRPLGPFPTLFQALLMFPPRTPKWKWRWECSDELEPMSSDCRRQRPGLVDLAMPRRWVFIASNERRCVQERFSTFGDDFNHMAQGSWCVLHPLKLSNYSGEPSDLEPLGRSCNVWKWINPAFYPGPRQPQVELWSVAQ